MSDHSAVRAAFIALSEDSHNFKCNCSIWMCWTEGLAVHFWSFFFFFNLSRSWLHWKSCSFSFIAVLRLKVALTLTHIRNANRAFTWWENHISLKQFKRIRLQFISMKLQDGGRFISQPLLLSLRVVSICITQIASQWEAAEHWHFLSPAGSACGEVTISKSVW